MYFLSTNSNQSFECFLLYNTIQLTALPSMNKPQFSMPQNTMAVGVLKHLFYS